jgi:prepilin-type N-terminal cleavage/methylation domain-containing protein
MCARNPASADGMRSAHPIGVRYLRCLLLRPGSDRSGAREVPARGMPSGRGDAPARNTADSFRSGLRARGFTLMEVMVAAGIFALAFAGLYAASNHVMNLIRRADSSAVAQRNCLARMDQLRSAAWAKATSPAFIAGMMAVPTGNAAFDKEIISVYRATVPATVPNTAAVNGSSLLFTVTRAGTAAPVISPSSFDQATIIDSFQLNFRVRTEWTRSAKAGARELSTIISKSASR